MGSGGSASERVMIATRQTGRSMAHARITGAEENSCLVGARWDWLGQPHCRSVPGRWKPITGSSGSWPQMSRADVRQTIVRITCCMVGLLLLPSGVQALQTLAKDEPVASVASAGRDSARALNLARQIIFELQHPGRVTRYQDILRAELDGQDVYTAYAATYDAIRPDIIHRIDQLGPRIWEDDWIIGQRVMLRIEQGLLLEALRVARGCRATGWWCLELHGMVLHLLGETEAAESAFASSLSLMPRLERCFSRDLLFIVDAETRTRYARHVDPEMRYRFDLRRGYREPEPECNEWAAVEEAFWWLADPFFIRAGNDRYTEHRTRVVASWLKAQYRNTIETTRAVGRPVHRGDSYQSLREFMWERAVREGWPPDMLTPRGWPPKSNLPGYAFDPSFEILHEPLGAAAREWRISSAAAPGYYAPAYGPVAEVEPQIAFFRRGDSVRVAAALDVRGYGSGIVAEDSVLAGLVLARSPREEPLVRTSRATGPLHRFQAVVPDRHYLVSLEILGDRNGAGRARFAWGLEQTIGSSASDLLLFQWTDDLPPDLDALIPLMLGSARVETPGSLGLYWETYGLDATERAALSVFLEPESSGWTRRLAERLGLRRERRQVGVSWVDDLDTGSGMDYRAHIIQLDLSALQPGRYALEVVVISTGGNVSTRRSIEIVR
jgi:hypothetical protein